MFGDETARAGAPTKSFTHGTHTAASAAAAMRKASRLCRLLLAYRFLLAPNIASGAALSRHRILRISRSCPPRMDVSVPAAVSLGAGMLGGAIGVGVAYPLDTMKTKLQARETSSEAGANESPLVVALDVVRKEGLVGFYGGVSSTMAGQAVIKGVVFFVYEWAKSLCESTGFAEGSAALLLSACLSGAVGSLFVTPVERIKCVMQASEAYTYDGPLGCARELVRTDGINGLLTRGLGATLLREVPAYGFYFVSYDLVKAALLDGALDVSPQLIPLIGGAVAGAMSWIPVYPIDVVKTNIQVLDGANGDEGFLGTAATLWKTGGLSAFWDGINPKLARAVVNHAVTFYVFEYVCSLPIWTT